MKRHRLNSNCSSPNSRNSALSLSLPDLGSNYFVEPTHNISVSSAC